MIAADLAADQRRGRQHHPVRLRGRRGASGHLGDLKPVFGMPVEGLIQAGCRTVYPHLTKPLADNMAEAFRRKWPPKGSGRRSPVPAVSADRRDAHVTLL
jgi:hypothetical protein